MVTRSVELIVKRKTVSKKTSHLNLPEKSEFYDSTRTKIVIDRLDFADLGVIETVELEFVRGKFESRSVIIFIGYNNVDESSGS